MRPGLRAGLKWRAGACLRWWSSLPPLVPQVLGPCVCAVPPQGDGRAVMGWQCLSAGTTAHSVLRVLALRPGTFGKIDSSYVKTQVSVLISGRGDLSGPVLEGDLAPTSDRS